MTGRLPTFACMMAILVLASSPAAADGLYVGAGTGRTSFSAEFEGLLAPIRAIDESSTGWKLFGGISGGAFAVEGGYRDFGTFKSDVASVNIESGTTAWDATALGRVRIPFIDLFGKAGVMWWSRETRIASLRDEITGTDFVWGVGAGLHVGPLGVRVEWERVELDAPEKLSMVSVSGTLGF